MKKLIFSLIFCLLTLPAFSDQQNSPTSSLEQAIDQVLVVLEKKFPDRSTKRKAVLEEVSKIFDFAEMSKRSLGTYWAKYDPKDQADFVDAFSNFLGNTYLGKIESATKDMIRFDTEQVKSNKAYVKTTVSVDDTKFPINYKLYSNGERWLVYDVVIENIGLISNYRNEFSGFLRKNPLNELTKRLNAKVAKADEA